MALASVLKVAFPEEPISFDDVDFSFGSDGSITINGTTYKEEIPQAVEEQAYVLLTFPPTVQVGIQFYQTAIQETGIYLNGWDEWYYINNENGAAIYQEPSTESPVLMRATYSNAVRKTEDMKFWIKVQYPNPECEDEYVEGWIAKRNLIPYADVEFYGDDAVCDK